MKKVYSFLQLFCINVILIVLVLFLSACSDNDDPVSKDPVIPGEGTWEVINAQTSGSNGLPDQNVEAICFNSSGEAVIRTEHLGITHYDGENWDTYDAQPSLYYIMYCDRNDNFWISAFDAIYTYTPGSYHLEVELGDDSGLPKSNKSKIFEDVDGTLWFEASNSLLSNINGEWTNHLFNAESGRSFQFSFLDFEGHTTVYDSVDFLQWDGSHWSAIEFIPDYDFTDARQVFCDSHGGMWLYKQGIGILLYDGVDERLMSLGIDMRVPSLNCFFEDSRGNVWINMRNHVLKYDRDYEFGSRSQAVLYSSDNTTYYRNIDEALDGEIWITSTDGIFILQNDNTRHLTTNGLPDNQIQALCEMNDGTVMASTGTGVYQQINGSWYHRFGDFVVEVGDMVCDADGGLWVSSPFGYLYVYKNGELTIYSDKQGSDLELSPEGKMLLAGYMGVYEYNNGVFDMVSDHPANCIDYYNGELVLGANYVVITNRELFPFCYDNSKRTMPAVKSDITLYIRDMVSDKNGNLWCTSEEGISRYDENEWVIYSDHATETVEETFNPLGTFYKQYIHKDFTLPEVGYYFTSTKYPIEVDSRGWVWFAFEKEIIVYDGQEFSVLPHPELSANCKIVDIDAMQDGSIWFSTLGNGVLIYKP